MHCGICTRNICCSAHDDSVSSKAIIMVTIRSLLFSFAVVCEAMFLTCVMFGIGGIAVCCSSSLPKFNNLPIALTDPRLMYAEDGNVHENFFSNFHLPLQLYECQMKLRTVEDLNLSPLNYNQCNI